MKSTYEDYASLEWISRHIKSIQGSLSPASRLVWIALQDLASSQSRLFVEGGVRNICKHLNLCDKTFKKAVDELQKNRLLTLREAQTSLGAHSFQYFPASPPNALLCKTRAMHFNYRDALLTQKDFGCERITVNQRILMIALLAITDGCGFVTELHVATLSQLTGIPSRNILSNLDKLKTKGLLARITSLRSEQRNKKTHWAYQLSSGAHPSKVKCVFDRGVHSEVPVISLLTQRKDIEEELHSLDIRLQNRWALKNFRMTSSAIEYYLYSAFLGAPEDVRHSLIKAIDSYRVTWKKLSGNGLLVYVDWLLQLAAIQKINYQSESPIPDMYTECLHTENLIKTQVNFFPLSPKQKEALIQILMPLSKMVATAMKNEINNVLPKVGLGQCQILVESFSQWMANHTGKPDQVSGYDLKILKYEPRYTKK